MEEHELREQDIKSKNECINIDNNPFSYTGRINRLVYFLTFLIIGIFRFFADFLKYLYDRNHNDYILYAYILGILIIGIIEIFAIIKRLRDIKWNPWLCLVGFVPYVTIIFRLLLIFIKGKYENTGVSQTSENI
ncbi:DUF805 domain-containing protein [bacterium]|nr:DUF805 domain-containing protein [bacterium]